MTETKELQNIVSTFERWSHLATLWPKETTKLYTITFLEKLPQILHLKMGIFTEENVTYSLKIFE